jgi:hypothetical protein
MGHPDYTQADGAELLVLTASDPEAFGLGCAPRAGTRCR